MARSTILITGFGPFPDMPVNASSQLARRLAAAARRRFDRVDVVSSVLPTEWLAAPERLAALHGRHAPTVALHFGVASRARGLEIERRAVNRCGEQPDAAGLLPPARRVVASAPAALPTTLPVEAILARLAALGIPASASDDAGSYLCNAVLYHSTCHVAAGNCGMAGFVHIPTRLPNVRSAAAPLTLAEAVAGGLAILDVCLAAAALDGGGCDAGRARGRTGLLSRLTRR